MLKLKEIEGNQLQSTKVLYLCFDKQLVLLSKKTLQKTSGLFVGLSNIILINT